MFSNSDLKKLIIPLIIEQVLMVTIGLADTVMVSSIGEEAISAVSLVDTINILIIGVFNALATGGAVVAAQFLGRRDTKNASFAAKQLILIVVALGAAVMLLGLLFGSPLLDLLYGEAEDIVLEKAKVYFKISAISYIFIGLYSAGAAIFRSMGNSKISMYTSLAMNIVNIGSNFTCIYVLRMNVAGAALGSLIARMFSAFIVLLLLKVNKKDIVIKKLFSFEYRPLMARNILSIGVPNGIETGMFQIGKILVQGLVASFGTVAIAANAVAISVANLAIIPGMAIGLAITTVIGQCIGAGLEDEAAYNTKKLIKLCYVILGILNIIIIFSTPIIVKIFNLTPETAYEASKILIYHSICCIFIWTIAFSLPNALRAANDVRFTMIVSTLSMWIFRIASSYIIGGYMGLGLMGVWIAMTIDWLVRAIIFAWRFYSGGWRGRKLI